MKKIVLDIETQNSFRDVGKSDPTALSIALLVVYDYETDKYTSFLEADFPNLWRILERTDMIIGYNSDYFDIPLLNKYYPGDLGRIKSLDLLSEIQRSVGKRLRLDAVAAGTLGKNKIASGMEAIDWWRSGEIDKIRAYCEEDVRITKEVYDYAIKNGALKYKEINAVREFPVNTSHWEEVAAPTAINFTLPF